MGGGDGGGGSRAARDVYRLRSARAEWSARRVHDGTVLRRAWHGRNRLREPARTAQEISGISAGSREDLAVRARLARPAELFPDPATFRISLGTRSGGAAHVTFQRNPGE